MWECSLQSHHWLKEKLQEIPTSACKNHAVPTDVALKSLDWFSNFLVKSSIRNQNLYHFCGLNHFNAQFLCVFFSPWLAPHGQMARPRPPAAARVGAWRRRDGFRWCEIHGAFLRVSKTTCHGFHVIHGLFNYHRLSWMFQGSWSFHQFDDDFPGNLPYGQSAIGLRGKSAANGRF